jgi:hypothetical protein
VTIQHAQAVSVRYRGRPGEPNGATGASGFAHRYLKFLLAEETAAGYPVKEPKAAAYLLSPKQAEKLRAEVERELARQCP